MNENWDDLIGRMRAVVIELERSLTSDEVQMIWELLDVGELGLAIEMLCSQLSEHGSTVDGEAIDRLRAVGTAMRLEPRQWEILRADQRR